MAARHKDVVFNYIIYVCHACGQFVNNYYVFFYTLFLIIILVLFSILGGLLFEQIEAPPERRVIDSIIRQRQSTLNQLQTKIQNGESKLDIILFVQVYEGAYIGAIRNGTVIEGGKNDQLWTYGGSVYYCMTTFSLVGYGNLAPKTSLGRVIAIIYCGFSVPITSLITGEIGEMLMSMFLFFWLNAIKLWSALGTLLYSRSRESSLDTFHGDRNLSCNDDANLLPMCICHSTCRPREQPGYCHSIPRNAGESSDSKTTDSRIWSAGLCVPPGETPESTNEIDSERCLEHEHSVGLSGSCGDDPSINCEVCHNLRGVQEGFATGPTALCDLQCDSNLHSANLACDYETDVLVCSYTRQTLGISVHGPFTDFEAYCHPREISDAVAECSDMDCEHSCSDLNDLAHDSKMHYGICCHSSQFINSLAHPRDEHCEECINLNKILICLTDGQCASKVSDNFADEQNTQRAVCLNSFRTSNTSGEVQDTNDFKCPSSNTVVFDKDKHLTECHTMRLKSVSSLCRVNNSSEYVSGLPLEPEGMAESAEENDEEFFILRVNPKNTDEDSKESAVEHLASHGAVWFASVTPISSVTAYEHGVECRRGEYQRSIGHTYYARHTLAIADDYSKLTLGQPKYDTCEVKRKHWFPYSQHNTCTRRFGLCMCYGTMAKLHACEHNHSLMPGLMLPLCPGDCTQKYRLCAVCWCCQCGCLTVFRGRNNDRLADRCVLFTYFRDYKIGPALSLVTFNIYTITFISIFLHVDEVCVLQNIAVFRLAISLCSRTQRDQDMMYQDVLRIPERYFMKFWTVIPDFELRNPQGHYLHPNLASSRDKKIRDTSDLSCQRCQSLLVLSPMVSVTCTTDDLCQSAALRVFERPSLFLQLHQLKDVTKPHMDAYYSPFCAQEHTAKLLEGRNCEDSYNKMSAHESSESESRSRGAYLLSKKEFYSRHNGVQRGSQGPRSKFGRKLNLSDPVVKFWMGTPLRFMIFGRIIGGIFREGVEALLRYFSGLRRCGRLHKAKDRNNSGTNKFKKTTRKVATAQPQKVEKTSPTTPRKKSQISLGKPQKKRPISGGRRRSRKPKQMFWGYREEPIGQDLEDEAAGESGYDFDMEDGGLSTDIDIRAKLAAEGIEESPVPILLIIGITLLYIGIGALVLTSVSANLSYFDSFWFIFISVVTIGYGDVVPVEQDVFLVLLFYLFLGLVLMASVINETSMFFTANMRKTKAITNDAMSIIRSSKEIITTKARTSHARRYWKIVRDRIRTGTIPKSLVEESRQYKIQIMAEERKFVKDAFRIYFQLSQKKAEEEEMESAEEKASLFARSSSILERLREKSQTQVAPQRPSWWKRFKAEVVRLFKLVTSLITGKSSEVPPSTSASNVSRQSFYFA